MNVIFSMAPRRLDEISRDDIMKNALRLIGRTSVGKSPAWVAVKLLCGVGSTSAAEICRDLNIDPDKPFKP